MTTHDARIAALEAAVAALTAELDALRTQRGTMKRDLRCTACGGQLLIHVREVQEHRGSFVVPMALGTSDDGPGSPFEVFVCRTCSLVEWYATGFGQLRIDGETVVAIEPTPRAEHEPYR